MSEEHLSETKRGRISLWAYGRANHHPFGRRRRLWAVLAVLFDPDARGDRRAWLRGTRYLQ